MQPQRISEIYAPGRFGLSIEIFPPKTPDGDESLFQTLKRLAVFKPAFISCTYGAGGSTRLRTLELCRAIQADLQLTATAHFTCVGSTREQLMEWLTKAWQVGIRNIMALRGDPPAGQQAFQAVDGGFSHADELVALIRGQFKEMGIGVAGYPEKHPEASSLQADIDNLKRKVDAGADVIYTQLFYINDNFFTFRDRLNERGIAVPLIPGIMPITDFGRIKRITSMCGTVFPDELAQRLEAVQEDKQAQFEIGVEHAIAQCAQLKRQGVPGIHFYVLNRPDACERILKALGIGPR